MEYLSFLCITHTHTALPRFSLYFTSSLSLSTLLSLLYFLPSSITFLSPSSCLTLRSLFVSISNYVPSSFLLLSLSSISVIFSPIFFLFSYLLLFLFSLSPLLLFLTSFSPLSSLSFLLFVLLSARLSIFRSHYLTLAFSFVLALVLVLVLVSF